MKTNHLRFIYTPHPRRDIKSDLREETLTPLMPVNVTQPYQPYQ